MTDCIPSPVRRRAQAVIGPFFVDVRLSRNEKAKNRVMNRRKVIQMCTRGRIGSVSASERGDDFVFGGPLEVVTVGGESLLTSIRSVELQRVLSHAHIVQSVPSPSPRNESKDQHFIIQQPCTFKPSSSPVLLRSLSLPIGS